MLFKELRENAFKMKDLTSQLQKHSETSQHTNSGKIMCYYLLETRIFNSPVAGGLGVGFGWFFAHTKSQESHPVAAEDYFLLSTLKGTSKMLSCSEFLLCRIVSVC